MASSPLVLQVLFGAVVTAAVIALISWTLQQTRPIELGDTAGAIEPDKSTAWFTVIGGFLMSLAGLYGVLFREVGWGALAMTLLGLGAAGFMPP